MSRRGARARVSRVEEPVAHRDRWLVSYGDFLTLLLAVFAALYAASRASEAADRARLKALTSEVGYAQAAVAASKAEASAERESLASMMRAAAEVRAAAAPSGEPEPAQPAAVDPAAAPAASDPLEAALGAAAHSLGRREDIRFAATARGMSMEIDASVLFAPAEATLNPDTLAAIDAIAAVLRRLDNPIEVQGHTDHSPIATTLYPSNWELAGARASAVVRRLALSGVAPQRLSAVSYGDNRPLDNGDLPDARARNRRVTLVVLTNVKTPAAAAALSPVAPKDAR